MQKYVKGFQEIGTEDLRLVGGKGLNLGHLAKIPDIRVPEGFCVTTDAYKRIVDGNAEMDGLFEELAQLAAVDMEKIGPISAKLREVIESSNMPEEVEREIISSIEELGAEAAYAVRSSATAEDLPTASFAGQQDSFLNIRGKREILRHVSKCWASLFTERTVSYRIQNAYDHRKVYLSVIIQRMVFPEASGILFTADPVTSNRKVTSIDASFGLGEALVSGIVSADNYKVREGKIVQKAIATKKIAIYPLAGEGTEKREISPAKQESQAIADQQILKLEKIGRRIEAHFGKPQDIEWCLVDDAIYIVQSRPITTLYPLPEKSDGQYRVYLSFGHQQMMTEPIRPLGMSFIDFMSDIKLVRAGGRLFMDMSPDLATLSGRTIFLNSMKTNDPVIYDALEKFLKRKPGLPKGPRMLKMGSGQFTLKFPVELVKIYRTNDRRLSSQMINQSEAFIREMEWRIQSVSGDELFAFILEDQKELRKLLYSDQSMAAIIIGVYAASWLNEHMEKWLGEKNTADILSQSVTNNVTSNMGLELLDVSDVVRNWPEVLAYFETPRKENFFEDLEKRAGGIRISQALQEYLGKYGMRCSGEIDITKTRWSEDPTLLVPVILNNIKNFGPDARRAKQEEGKKKAVQKAEELLVRLERLPRGRRKAGRTKKMIGLLHNFLGYREYPKFAFIKRYYFYKQALMKEAALLQIKGLIEEAEDIYYLSFEEFRAAVNGQAVDRQIIEERKEAYRYYEKLVPPRLMTSEGEQLFGDYPADKLPYGALAGIPVSAGVVEGRAKVVLKMQDAHIEAGDILVTPFTDPSWTPMFVSLAGLVTEVGGLMTHGAVIAREYGLPAVVSVDNATKIIKDGQKIRINGSEGYVEVLEQPKPETRV